MSCFEEALFGPLNRSMHMTFYSVPTVRHYIHNVTFYSDPTVRHYTQYNISQ